MIYIVVFLILLLLSFFDFSQKRIEILYFILFILILFVGFRGHTGADSTNYINYFRDNTDTVFSWEGTERGYAEAGFYYLSVLLKSIWANINFYFLVIGALTLGFYACSIKHLSVYPILSICIYFARFIILREMNQIRAGLAISVIIWGLYYLTKNERRKYIFSVLLATLLHYSSIVALPLVLFYNKTFNFKKTLLIISLGVTFGLFGTLIKNYIVGFGGVVILTYMNTSDLGLTNPVILYQVILCLIYIYFGRRIKHYQYGYEVIKNAYIYSTFILLVTSGFGIIGGRLATIFATCEIFIIPDFVKLVKPHIAGFVIVLIITSLLFYLNYTKLLAL